MKFIWITDPHLNMIDINGRQDFYNEIKARESHAIFMTGDIAESSSLEPILTEVVASITQPVYFVLGNHDYYGDCVENVRSKTQKLTQRVKNLYWLSGSEPHVLCEDIILVGQDGWADGRYGDYEHSNVLLNDSLLISDLFDAKMLGRASLLTKMQQLADADSIQLKKSLIKAVTKYDCQKIIILTHVPPFDDACVYQGRKTESDFLPFFSSKAIGDVLLEMALTYEHISFLVLCGHTHASAFYSPLKNLSVLVGKAEYFKPEVQQITNHEMAHNWSLI